MIKQDYLNVKPIVKWVGGKTKMLSQIKDLMPQHFNRYFEPFFGGGAVWFALVDPTKHASFLSDVNAPLVHLYSVIRQTGFSNLATKLDDLTKRYNAASSEKQKQMYLQYREQFNAGMPKPAADLFIFLNKTDYNGLYRVNLNGKFNAPFGYHKHVSLYDPENLARAQQKLSKAFIVQQSFAEALRADKLQKDDFVFLDPPYYNEFSGYARRGFNIKDQKELAKICQQLDKKQVKLMITNNDCQFIRNLYTGFNFYPATGKFAMNHGSAKEVIITNYQN